MEYQTIEDMLESANGSVYSLVRMASMRALELADGKPPLIENPDTDKVTSISFKEIIAGKVELKETAERKAKEAKEKAKKEKSK